MRIYEAARHEIPRDFFFGAMDTGMDAQKTNTVGFYGPFASISVGIGG